MRKDLSQYGRTFDAADREFQKMLRSRNVSLNDLKAAYFSNQSKLESYLSKENNKFLRESSKAGMTEQSYIRNGLTAFSADRSIFEHSKVQSASRTLQRAAKKLPAYS